MDVYKSEFYVESIATIQCEIKTDTLILVKNLEILFRYFPGFRYMKQIYENLYYYTKRRKTRANLLFI